MNFGVFGKLIVVNNTLRSSWNASWTQSIRAKHKYPKKVRDRLDYSKVGPRGIFGQNLYKIWPTYYWRISYITNIIPFQVPRLDFEGADRAKVEERLARGGGPGGQAVAKTNNAVTLVHLPTGTVVKCHETRSVAKNREIARENLVAALDRVLNGEDSVEAQAARIELELSLKTEESARRSRQVKTLTRLQERHDKLQSRIDQVKGCPADYLDPEAKLQDLSAALEEIKEKILKLQGQQDAPLSVDKDQKD